MTAHDAYRTPDHWEVWTPRYRVSFLVNSLSLSRSLFRSLYLSPPLSLWVRGGDLDGDEFAAQGRVDPGTLQVRGTGLLCGEAHILQYHPPHAATACLCRLASSKDCDARAECEVPGIEVFFDTELLAI
jgi:hypothetical protein